MASISLDKVINWVMGHVVDNEKYFAVGPLKLFGLDLKTPSISLFGMEHYAAITSHYVYLLLGLVVFLLLMIFGYKKGVGAPSGIAKLLEPVIVYVRDEICKPNLGPKDGRKLAPWFLTFFFLVLFLNLMGLIPGFGSVTGNLMFTMAVASVVLFFMTFYVLFKNGPKAWFSAFVPHGVPLPILLLVTPLEIIGLLIKSGVLGLRLFANLLAGHIALLIMMGLVLAFGLIGAFFTPLVIFVFMLEILVAFLQAYIFTMLAALFVGQVLHPAH